MRCTLITEQRIVVESLYREPHHLLPPPLHTLDYQTDTLRFEFPNNPETWVALRLCGVAVPIDRARELLDRAKNSKASKHER